jgi:selenide,water dikinase
VTGFGLLGHLHNLCRESKLSAVIHADALPALSGALDLLADGVGVSGGGSRNYAHAAEFTTFAEHVPEPVRLLAADPQTSGGLLVAVSAGRAGELDGGVVGRLVAGVPGAISLE